MGVRDFLHQAFGPQFGEFVAQGGELVLGRRQAQGLGDLRVKFTGGQGPPGRQVREAHQGLHKGQLARVASLSSGIRRPFLVAVGWLRRRSWAILASGS